MFDAVFATKKNGLQFDRLCFYRIVFPFDLITL